MADDYPILYCKNVSAWHTWLAKHHADQPGVWLQFSKKNSPTPSVRYAEALDEALCYGWIDSLVHTRDEFTYLQKFTPRRPKSIWSKINIQKIQKLIDAGKMKPSGLAQVELAKKDGRWDAAYDSPSTMSIPPEFLKELKKNTAAYAFYKTLTKSNLYAIAWRIQTAKKAETKLRRIHAIISTLAKNEKLY